MTVRIESKIRHRDSVANEALSMYVETHLWQIEHVRSGLREANAGIFVPEREMRRLIGRLRRR
jgi:predicted transcriptional regulator